MAQEEFRVLPREKQIWYFNHYFGWLIGEIEYGRKDYIGRITTELLLIIEAGNFSQLEVLEMQKNLIERRLQAQQILEGLTVERPKKPHLALV